MNYRTYPSLLLVLVILLFSVEALATHKTIEKYDGTINSFRWLNRPLAVNHVQFKNKQEEVIGLLRSYIDWDNAETDVLIKRLIAGVSPATLKTEKLQKHQTE